LSGSGRFELHAGYAPAGDQPAAIAALIEGLEDGLAYQTLLGVTGSGKTFTIANVISAGAAADPGAGAQQDPGGAALRRVPEFFPDNAVEYFVSYYDYYQPEAYVPSSDTYIEKDSSINDHIEQMRLSATKALLEREDVHRGGHRVGDLRPRRPGRPTSRWCCTSTRGDDRPAELLRRLAELQYTRNDMELQPRHLPRARRCHRHIPGRIRQSRRCGSSCSTTRSSALAVRSADRRASCARSRASPSIPRRHYATPRETTISAMEHDQGRAARAPGAAVRGQNKLVEVQRLSQRTQFDLEMISRARLLQRHRELLAHLSGARAGRAAADAVRLPAARRAAGGRRIPRHHSADRRMYKGDRARKETLVEYGFRLPSALDNRPLRFEEWEALTAADVSCLGDPGAYELRRPATRWSSRWCVRPAWSIPRWRCGRWHPGRRPALRDPRARRWWASACWSPR
jgi:excinuclease ABC subunit B